MKYSKFNLIINTARGEIAVFNTLTGNCFIIDENIKNSILNHDVNLIKDYSIYEEFIDKLVIIEDNVDENRYFEYYSNKFKFDSSTIGATILLSWACNLACVYCYEGAASKKGNLTKESADKIIKFMKSQAINSRSKKMNINLFGGEPLINIKIGNYILKELKYFCENNNIVFNSSIITNGTLLHKEIIDSLFENNCRYFQVTLDGKKEIHDKRRIYKNGSGSYDKVIKSLILLNSNYRKISTVIRINVDKENITGTYELLELIGKNGLNLTNCNVDFGIVRSSTSACSSYSSKCFVENEVGDIINSLTEKAISEGFKFNLVLNNKWIFCGLYNEYQYTISPECDLYKCWEHVGEKEHKIAEIDNEGNIVNTKFAFFDWMTHNPLENEYCRNCVYLPVCGGGCGAISYNTTKTYHSIGCFKVKGVIEKQIEKYIDRVLNCKMEK